MDINEGSHIHSVRIYHFLGALNDYARLDLDQLDNFIRIAKEREKNPTVRYHPDIEEKLKELARLLS